MPTIGSACRQGVACFAACTLSVGPCAWANTPDAALACTDFDAYVNGSWAALAELPPERARIGSFDTLRVANDTLLASALEALVNEPARQTTPSLKLLASFYRSGMDVDAIERRGLGAAAPLLQRIDGLRREQLPQLLADMARLRLNPPLSVGVSPDAMDATRYALQIGASGLGLPDRDDYLGTEAETQRLQAAYRRYVARLLAASGETVAADTVDSLMAFERELASATVPRAQRRDPRASYNPQTVASLAKGAPGLDWGSLLTRYTQRETKALEAVPMILADPGFATAVARLAQNAPLAQWRLYLRVRVLDALADKLPREFAQAHFDYRDAAIRGLKSAPSRAEQLLMALGGRTGGAPLAQALGELYVMRAFSPLAQQRALQMLADIRAAMAERIRTLAWMSAATKAEALAKLELMVAQIGAPAQWRPYDGLALAPDDYAGNQLRASEWASARELHDLGRAVDRQRWNTSPYIVNAFAAGGNRIVFPAGILQPPFFDANADEASNYGAIGSIIGHEITHHFDDRGRHFDARGNLRDWWSADDASQYQARAERLVQLYNQYEPAPGARINGRLTLGENIADLAGVQIAFDGLQRALQRQRALGQTGQAPALVDGRTPEQRFFVANALVWRSKMRIEALQNQLRTDSHSPTRFRVLGPLSNSEAFARAFGCKAGDPMVAAERIVIW